MTLATDIRDDIAMLFNEVGSDVQVIFVEPGSGPEPSATETIVTLRGAFQSQNRRWSHWEMQDGDKMITLSPTNVPRDLRRGDIVIAGGERWPVVNMRRREVQGTVIAYTLQLRR